MLEALTRVLQYSIAARKGEKERARDRVPGKLRTGEERVS